MNDREFGNSRHDYGTTNPYYNPENCGLEIAETISESGLSWEFNDVIVWQDAESGEFFYAHDSGCSCPTPFESFTKLSDLTHLTLGSFEEFEKVVQQVGDSRYDHETNEWSYTLSADQKQQVQNVRMKLQGRR